MSANRDQIATAVENLTDEGSTTFRASAIARCVRATAVEAVTPMLMQMVRDGRLRLRFDLLCPDNGRTITSFRQEDDLPIGKEWSSDRCAGDEPFIVERRHIWVQFVPTNEFRVRVRRNRVQASRPPERPPDDDPPGMSRRTWTHWTGTCGGVR
jgi:hypothetical protein